MAVSIVAALGVPVVPGDVWSVARRWLPLTPEYPDQVADLVVQAIPSRPVQEQL
jgi:hypothetical protein